MLSYSTVVTHWLIVKSCDSTNSKLEMDRREKQSLKTYEIFYQREKHSKGLDCTIQNWVKVNRREESDFKKPKTMPVVEAPITTPLAEQGSFIMMERKGSFTFLSDFGDESPGGSFTFLSDWSGDVSPEPVQYELDVNLLLNQLQESCDPPSPPTTEAIIPESTMEEVGTPVEVSRKESKKFTDFLKNNKVAPYLDIDAWMRYLRSGGPGSDPMYNFA